MSAIASTSTSWPRLRATRLESGEQVLDHLLGLSDGVALPDDVSPCVQRDGAGREDHGPTAAHRDVRVAGGRGERVDVAELDRHG